MRGFVLSCKLDGSSLQDYTQNLSGKDEMSEDGGRNEGRLK